MFQNICAGTYVPGNISFGVGGGLLSVGICYQTQHYINPSVSIFLLCFLKQQGFFLFLFLLYLQGRYFCLKEGCLELFLGEKHSVVLKLNYKTANRSALV